MTAMRFVGVPARAREARAALNRLRWEVDYAIDQGRAAEAAPADLAEAVGILTNIMRALAAAMPEEPSNELEQVMGAPRERFLAAVEHFTTYHQVGR